MKVFLHEQGGRAKTFGSSRQTQAARKRLLVRAAICNRHIHVDDKLRVHGSTEQITHVALPTLNEDPITSCLHDI